MKKLFAIAALLAAFSPLSQAQDMAGPHPHDDARPAELARPGSDLRNDRHVEVAPPHHMKARRTVRCRDGSRQFSVRACRSHHGMH